jgi:hypothetical protein
MQAPAEMRGLFSTFAGSCRHSLGVFLTSEVMERLNFAW